MDSVERKTFDYGSGIGSERNERKVVPAPLFIKYTWYLPNKAQLGIYNSSFIPEREILDSVNSTSSAIKF
jgi:hypothetical protein